jgi:hypothetical protein
MSAASSLRENKNSLTLQAGAVNPHRLFYRTIFKLSRIIRSGKGGYKVSDGKPDTHFKDMWMRRLFRNRDTGETLPPQSNFILAARCPWNAT